jgi:hypothetical protein
MDRVAIWFGPLNINDIHSIHDDLQLTLGDLSQLCDSYYFKIDEKLMDRTDIAGAIARFLGLWIRRLDKLRRRPGQVLLPFDFADQGSMSLRV